MIDLRLVIGASLAVIGTAALIAAAPAIEPAARAMSPASNAINTVAALAWASANCERGAALNLRPGTPRLQSDDLLRIAAALDQSAVESGLGPACAAAIRDA